MVIKFNPIPVAGGKDKPIHKNPIGGEKLHHYITKYQENGETFVEAWLQINLFGKCYCFWKRKIKI